MPHDSPQIATSVLVPQYQGTYCNALLYACVAALLQEHKALQHQLQDVTAAQVNSLSQELSQLKQRHEAAAAKLGSEAAATQAHVAELKQWFDANQVGCLGWVTKGVHTWFQCSSSQHGLAWQLPTE